MVDLDLEEIRKKLKSAGISLFWNYATSYDFVEYFEPDEKDSEGPIFKVPSEATILRKYEAPPFAHRICFGDFTHTDRRSQRSRIVFTVRMYTKIENEGNAFRTDNNYCFLNKEQIGYWLSECKEMAGLDFYFRIVNRETYYDVILDFKHLSKIQMKFILFWTRYLYETPANLSVLDTLILKKNYFPDESLLNLLILTTFVQDCNVINISVSQCLVHLGHMVTEKHLRFGLNTFVNVSSIFLSEDVGYYRMVSEKRDTDEENHLYGSRLSIVLGNGYVIEPFVEKKNLYSKNGFLPVQDWLDKEDRFRIYTEVYDYLKQRELQ